MRDGVLMVLVVILSLSGVVRPVVGVLAYSWFSIMRPDVMAYSVGRPYSMILAAATLLGSLRELPLAFSIVRSPVVLGFFLLQACYGLSVILAQSTDLCFPAYRNFLVSSLMAMLLPILVRTWQDLKMMVIVCGVSMLMLGAKMGLFGVLAGGVEFRQGYGGNLSDNNMIALGLCMGIPLSWHMRGLMKAAWWKPLSLIMVSLSSAAVLMTHSRGGILTLGAISLLIAKRSRKILLALALLGALALPGILLVNSSLSKRMSTLSRIERDDSAMGRLLMWQAAFKLSLDYPLAGVGFGGDNWLETAPKYLRDTGKRAIFVHNNYLQVLVDCGYPALIVFCSVLFGAILWLQRILREARSRDPELYEVTAGLQGSLLAFALGSMFLSRVMYDYIYIMLMATATLQLVLRLRREPVAEAGASAVPGPVPAPVPVPAAPQPETPAWAAPGMGKLLRSRRSAPGGGLPR